MFMRFDSNNPLIKSRKHNKLFIQGVAKIIHILSCYLNDKLIRDQFCSASLYAMIYFAEYKMSKFTFICLEIYLLRFLTKYMLKVFKFQKVVALIQSSSSFLLHFGIFFFDRLPKSKYCFKVTSFYNL